MSTDTSPCNQTESGCRAMDLVEQIALNSPERLPPLRRGRRRLRRDGLQRRLDQIANRPHAISDPERHCRGRLQGFVSAAEIVERDMEADRRKVAIQLL